MQFHAKLVTNSTTSETFIHRILQFLFPTDQPSLQLILKRLKKNNFILLSLPAKNETIQSNDVIATIDVIDAIDDILEKFVVGWAEYHTARNVEMIWKFQPICLYLLPTEWLQCEYRMTVQLDTSQPLCDLHTEILF